MKQVPRVLLLLALVGALFVPAWLAQPVQAQSFGSNWTGLYFNNPTFSGAPALTRIDPQINFNFGTNSPAPGFLGTENYSISWTAAQTFAAGTYRFTAVADDGVRVRIDGTTIIDALTPTGGIQTINVEVAVADGARTINVDYVQNTGIGVIQFFWVPVTTQPAGPTATPAPPTQTPLPAIPPGALRATVIRAGILNVRDAPSLGGNRIDRILRGQTYQVVGRNENATWFLLQLVGKQGWAWGYYLFIDGNEFNAPVVSGLSALGLPPGVSDTGVLAVTRAGLRLRAAPTVESAQIGRVDWGAFVPVVGRTPGSDWYQIVWKGTVGWVAASFLQIRQGSLDAVPIR